MIYCFDLDNTLCNTPGSNYMEAIPYRNRIARVNQLYDEGHTIIVETARGCVSGKNWFYQTMEQLKSWGLKFHTLRTGVKYNADIFVDDRAMSDTEFFSDKFKESGSGGNTKLLLVNRVRKEATNERMEKLIDEVNFIQDLPSEFKEYFPRIITHGVKDGTSYYEMENYNLPSLRRLIFAGSITADEVVNWMQRITKFSIQMLKHTSIDMPRDYIKEMQWDRFDQRMEELNKVDIFKRLLAERKLQVNSKWYDNAYQIVDKIRKLVSEKPDLIKPPFVGIWSHSDLHFSNILIDRENDTFKLIDPRGYPYCDPLYDFGKLWHSVNGKYEMVVNDMYSYYETNMAIYYNLTQNNYYRILTELKERIPAEVFTSKYLKYMPGIEFNEAMHFITLVPFQLAHDGKEQRAKVAYAIGIELLNKWYEKYGI